MLNSSLSERKNVGSKRAHILGTTILVTLLAGPALAQDLTWSAGDDTWDTTSNNWDGNTTAFTFGNSATFNDADDTVTVSNGGTAIEVNNITFNAGGITLTGADGLTIAGDVDVAGGSTVTQQLDVTDNLNKVGAGVYAISGGNVGGTTTVDGGQLVVATGGALNGALTVTTGEARINNGSIAGTSNVANGASLVLNDGTAQNVNLNATSSFTLGPDGDVMGTLDTNATFTFSDGTLSGDVENSGTFTIVDDRTVGGEFTNETGGILSDGGTAGNQTLTVSGDVFTNAGDIQSTDLLTIDSAQSTLQTGSTINGAAELDGTVRFDGALTTEADMDVTGDITLLGRLENDATLGVDAEIDANGFTIQNNATLNVNATGSVVNGGTLDNNGDMTIADGASATFTIVDTAGAGTLLTVDGTLTAPAITNAANADLTVATTGRVNGNITNSTGATLTLNGDGVEDAAGDINGAVNNSATFDLNAGSVGEVTNSAGGAFTSTGASTIDTTLDNTGGGSVASIDTGTLTVQGAGVTNDDGASMTVALGAELISGTVTNDTSASLDVDGTLTGDVTNFADMTVDGDVDGNVDNRAFGTDIGDLTVTGEVTGTLNNRATLDLNGATVGTIENDRAATFGTMNVLAGGATAETFNNSGVVEFSDGTLTVTGPDRAINRADGEINLDSGQLVADVTNNAGAELNISGTGDLDGDVFNAGTLTMDGGSVGSVTNTMDFTSDGAAAIDGDLDNAGTATVATGTLTVGGDVNNEAGGVMTIANDVGGTGRATLDAATTRNLEGGQMVVEGRVLNELRNAGDLDINQGRLDTLTNLETGVVDVTNGGRIETQLFNGNEFNLNSGTLVVDTNDAVNGPDGTMTIASVGTLDSDLTNRGILDVAGTVDGAITNEAGDITLDGTLTGDLANDADGTVDLTGTMTGDVSNAGTFDLSGALTGGVTNSGTFGLTGDVTGDVSNAGTFDLSGDMTGDLSSTGTTDLSGTLTGDVASTGPLTLSGTLDGMLDSTGMLDFSGTSTGLVTIRSSAAFHDGSSMDGLVITDGSTATVDGMVSTGGLTLDAGSTLDLQDGTPGDILAVAGDAVLNGIVELDVDYAANTSDRIDVDGAATGDVMLRFDIDPSASTTGGDIELIRTGDTTGPALTYSIDGLAGTRIDSGGLYAFEVVSGPGGSLSLEGQVGAAVQGISAVAGLTQSLVGTVINRPTSPYVSGFDPFGGEPCGQGVWIRATGGEADADGVFTEASSTSGSNVPLSLTYRGFQAGSDYACFDAVNGGWDLAFGAIAGLNDGDSTGGITGAITETDFTQKYAGLYMVASKGRFLADLQYRYEQTDFDVTGASLDAPTAYDSKANTLSGSVAYAFPIRTGLQAATNIGFSLTDTSFDVIDVLADGENSSIDIDGHVTKVGFAGVTLSNLRENRDGQSAIAFFANATYYKDFSDPISGRVQSTGSLREFEVDTLGDYGELSLGLNYTRLLDDGQLGRGRQLDAGIRLDARRGSNLDSWGITGQVRIQF